MKLLIKQRVFSWRATFDVYDENQKPKYLVKADRFTMGFVIRVYDKATNNEVGIIRRTNFGILPKFEVEIDGRIIGTIQQRFSLFHPKFEVDYKGWRVEGDFFGWDYDVMSGCSSIIKINKELFNWGDTYTIKFSNPDDEIFGLLLVIAIDAGTTNN